MGLLDKLLPPSHKKFAQLVMQGLREAGETRPIEYEKDRFRLIVEEKPLPLAAFYREFCDAAPDERDAVVRRVIGTWRIETPQTTGEFSPNALRPALWPRSVVEFAALQQENDELTAPWPHHIVAEHLVVVVAHKTAAGLRALRHEELARRGMDYAQAHEQACRNLRQQSSPWRRAQGGYWYCESRDGSASARLLFDDEIASLELAGEPVVLAPQRDVLLAGGAEDAAVLVAAAKRASSEFDHPHAVSGFAFRLSDGQWRPWLPTPEHPAYTALKLLQLESQARDYLQQQRLFAELGRKAEAPLCLASFSAMEDADSGRPLSFLVWPDGLEILLPQADQVLFFQPDATGGQGDVVARAGWDRVRLTLGDLMEPLNVYPPRYLVRDFPSAERLQALMSEDATRG